MVLLLSSTTLVCLTDKVLRPRERVFFGIVVDVFGVEVEVISRINNGKS